MGVGLTPIASTTPTAAGKLRHTPKGHTAATQGETIVLNVVDQTAAAAAAQQPNANRPKKNNKAAKHAADFF
jgi:hypothetical protein